MNRLIILTLFGLLSSAYAAATLPAAEIEQIKLVGLKLRTIVTNFERLNYSSAIAKKGISDTTCTKFYNEIAEWDRNYNTPWFNASDYQNSVQAIALENMFGSALQLASACSYKNTTELLEFNMYYELNSRDQLFYRYVMDE